MATRPASTILLITRSELVRADFSRGPKVTLLNIWTQPRPDLPDVASLAEAAMIQGPKVGKKVWIFSTDLWPQTLELAANKSTGVSAADLASALNFEAEALSGHSAFESVVAYVPQDTHDGYTTFWIVQANSSDVDQLDDLIRKAGAKLIGVGHPGGLLRTIAPDADPAKTWERIELWPDAVLAMRGAAEAPPSIRVFNSDPQMGRWKKDVTGWQSGKIAATHRELLIAPTVTVPLDTEDAKLFRLDNEAALGVWMVALVEHLAQKHPNLPLVKPKPVPLSTGQRRAIAAVLALLVLGISYVHYQFALERPIKAALAEGEQLRQPGKLLPDLDKQLKDLQTKHEQLDNDVKALDRAAHRIDLQRRRLLQLLTVLAETKSEDLLVQKIDTDKGEPRIHGVCLQPELADQFASTLAEKLRASGWEVQTPKKQAKYNVASGAPWKFEITMKTPPDPSDAKAPAAGRGGRVAPTPPKP